MYIWCSIWFRRCRLKSVTNRKKGGVLIYSGKLKINQHQNAWKLWRCHLFGFLFLLHLSLARALNVCVAPECSARSTNMIDFQKSWVCLEILKIAEIQAIIFYAKYDSFKSCWQKKNQIIYIKIFRHQLLIARAASKIWIMASTASLTSQHINSFFI